MLRSRRYLHHGPVDSGGISLVRAERVDFPCCVNLKDCDCYLSCSTFRHRAERGTNLLFWSYGRKAWCRLPKVKWSWRGMTPCRKSVHWISGYQPDIRVVINGYQKKIDQIWIKYLTDFSRILRKIFSVYLNMSHISEDSGLKVKKMKNRWKQPCFDRIEQLDINWISGCQGLLYIGYHELSFLGSWFGIFAGKFVKKKVMNFSSSFFFLIIISFYFEEDMFYFCKIFA